MPMTYETDDTRYEYAYTQSVLCTLIEYYDPFQWYMTPAERLQADESAPAMTIAPTEDTDLC